MVAVEKTRAVATKPASDARAMRLSLCAVSSLLRLSLGDGDSQLVVLQRGLEARTEVSLNGSNVTSATARSQLEESTIDSGRVFMGA